MGMKDRLSPATSLDELQRKAHEAAADGHLVFTPTLRPRLTAQDTEPFGELIAAVEAQGWWLDQWSVTAVSQAGVLVGCPVFRRA